jgi:hypothetical protein
MKLTTKLLRQLIRETMNEVTESNWIEEGGGVIYKKDLEWSSVQRGVIPREWLVRERPLSSVNPNFIKFLNSPGDYTGGTTLSPPKVYQGDMEPLMQMAESIHDYLISSPNMEISDYSDRWGSESEHTWIITNYLAPLRRQLRQSQSWRDDQLEPGEMRGHPGGVRDRLTVIAPNTRRNEPGGPLSGYGE